MTKQFFFIGIHFLGDMYHGRGDQDEPEWPPSPLRLFQALVATNARLGNQADEALRWLERQEPPILLAARRAAIQPRGRTTYVPDNVADLVARSWVKGGDKDISSYRLAKFVRPTYLENKGEFPTVQYLWPLAEGENIPASTELVGAARAISQLGWGIDLVVVDAGLFSGQQVSRLSGERWLPSNTAGGKSLRRPVTGTLTGLKDRHQAFLHRIRLDSNVFRPVPPLSQFAVSTYRRATEISRPPYAVFAIRKPDDSGFLAFSPQKRGLHLSGMMRHAASRPDFVTSLGWDDDKVAAFVMGHAESRTQESHQPVNGARLVFIPLPSSEWQGEAKGNRVGAIRRVLVTVTEHITDDAFHRLVHHLEGRELIDEKTGKVVAFLRRQSSKDRAISRYFHRTSEWVSVTPVILPGYDDPGKLRRRLNTATLTSQEKTNIVHKLETRIDHLLRKALSQAGYPPALVQHAELQWRGAGFTQGTGLATAYVVPAQHRRFRRLHIRILWRNSDGEPLDQPGPHCIGGGRFVGLGLLAPAPD
ncbi:MAG: type I-U CRISPR-associated protein Csb2 [Desulfopila sp.]